MRCFNSHAKNSGFHGSCLPPSGQEITKKERIYSREITIYEKIVVFLHHYTNNNSIMAEIKSEETSEKKSLNFIEQIVENDLKEGKNDGKVQTRFPPEPNGYLHIGHAKAICLDFGIAAAHGGVCNLRFDDTNPTKEDVEYVEAIKEDIQWLGYQWGNDYDASDYFQQLWDFAIRLIKEGKAYIDEQTSEQIAAQKGTPTQPGVESPYRNRPSRGDTRTVPKDEYRRDRGRRHGAPCQNRHGKSQHALPRPDYLSRGETSAPPYGHYLESLPDVRLRSRTKRLLRRCNPLLVYTGIRSSPSVVRPLCRLGKRGKDLNDHRPHQYEFNKLNLSYTLMSKRNLLTLVKEGLVNGWDDPRMPTICGFRRRGYSPESIHKFIDKIGYTTYDALNEFALLESAVREDLNARATRISAVLNPVKLVITNYPEGQVEEMEAVNNPERPEEGSHNIEFSRELWIERDDFMEDAPKKYFRMTPGQEVRLKSAYIVKCTGCKKNDAGEITEVYCEYDPDSKSGMPGANRKVKGTIHWVSCAHCLQAEVRLYDRLWKVENPRDELAAIREEKNCDALTAMKEMINPDSVNVLPCCYIEKFAAGMKPLSYLQFQRIGYFNVDRDSTPEKMVFNRTVGLKDTWGKINK